MNDSEEAKQMMGESHPFDPFSVVAAPGAAVETAPAAPAGHIPLPARVLDVTHETVYTYDAPVRRSTHLFRLRPVVDDRQDVLHHHLELAVDGERRSYEDVFGNRVVAFRPSEPFRELRIRARSRVRVRGAAEGSRVAFSSPLAHPVVWMPWQRMMMLPYLMPPELPESQLSDLSSYALGFVRGAGGDLVEALQQMNQGIHSSFAYMPGSTDLETTPYETFVQRRGVCQDFAYLFMCLAQLLNVPARYRVGYIYTGGNYDGQLSSDASHAWAEVYLPHFGWYGFDPANGKGTADVDYVRVSAGRHYRDAAPVTGTIFEGGGGERLQASVRVELLED
jgi:transglutaminase-like putative cysteine protease